MRYANPTDQEEAQPNFAPIAVRPHELARLIGVSHRHIYKLINHPDPARRLPTPFKMGRATFWRFADVQAWLDRQAALSAAA
jgi:predicted DNA-binding transcriptional regulator AlpA